jgi:ABC-type multidrug transport system ATPase subunit
MTAIIEVRQLRQSFGERTVLDGLNLEIEGGIFALLGPNGAGKTTLVSILTTLLRPDAGNAYICGHDVVHEPRLVRRMIGATGQYASVDDQLTARENLGMIGRLLGLARSQAQERAAVMLDRFGLSASADRRVADFSGGMRRRVDLAASLMRTPAVLFLDEPTTGLDPASRAQIWEDVASLSAEGCTILLTTQMLDEAEQLADRVAIIANGGIVADGTVPELLSRVGEEKVTLIDDAGQSVRTLSAAATAGGLATALAGLSPEERALHVDVRRPTLDDAFLALTAQQSKAAAA